LYWLSHEHVATKQKGQSYPPVLSMYRSWNGLEADAKIVVQIHNPRGGGGWSHLLVHRGGTPLDEGVLSWPVCQLSSSGYEPSAIGKNLHFFFRAQVPQMAKSVCLVQSILIHWKRPHKLIWWWIVQRPLIAIYARLPPLAVIWLPEPNAIQQGIPRELPPNDGSFLFYCHLSLVAVLVWWCCAVVWLWWLGWKASTQ